jgi:hypothetical protein
MGEKPNYTPEEMAEIDTSRAENDAKLFRQSDYGKGGEGRQPAQAPVFDDKGRKINVKLSEAQHEAYIIENLERTKPQLELMLKPLPKTAFCRSSVDAKIVDEKLIVNSRGNKYLFEDPDEIEEYVNRHLTYYLDARHKDLREKYPEVVEKVSEMISALKELAHKLREKKKKE